MVTRSAMDDATLRIGDEIELKRLGQIQFLQDGFEINLERGGIDWGMGGFGTGLCVSQGEFDLQFPILGL